MNENRRQVLEMLAAGKISADEAERLLAALEKEPVAAATAATPESAGKPRPRYLRLQVEDCGKEEGKPVKVNVRVPMQLLRAGVKLAGLLPVQAHEHVNQALHVHGVKLDLSQIKPENLEEIISQLEDVTVDVDEPNKTKVRMYCE